LSAQHIHGTRLRGRAAEKHALPLLAELNVRRADLGTKNGLEDRLARDPAMRLETHPAVAVQRQPQIEGRWAWKLVDRQAKRSIDFRRRKRQGFGMLGRTASMLTLALCACKTSAPVEAETPTRVKCEIQLSVEREASGGSWFLHAVATNQTDRPLHLELKGQCPGGAVEFSGLGDGYDYYGTCVMGPCSALEDPVIELPPGASVRLATAVIAPKGNGCQPALSEAEYSVTFALPLKAPSAVLCEQALRIDHKLE
jgi:hypothetical protein